MLSFNFLLESFLTLRVLFSPPRYIIFDVVFDHRVENDSDLMGGGGGCSGWPEFALHPPKITSHGRLVVMKAHGSQAKQLTGSMVSVPRPPPQHPSAADIVVGAQPGPGDEVGCGGPLRHISPYFGEQGKNIFCQSGYLRQVYSKQLIGFSPKIETGLGVSQLVLVSPLFLFSVRRQRPLFRIHPRRKLDDQLLDLLITNGDLRLVVLIAVARLS